MTQIRPAAVAGLFYPAEPDELTRMVDGFLERHARDDHPPPKAVIVPHAGFIYSGDTAAAAFALLQPLRNRIRRVVMLGPAHRVPFEGVCAPESECFQTPLGEVSVDQMALARISALPQVIRSDEPHRQEHCLEVELPFLQRLLNDNTVLPLLVGDATPSAVAEVIDILWGDQETLILISSDLSHFHDRASARAMDDRTSRRIERMQAEALGFDDACGRLPIAGLLHTARRRGMRVEVLARADSGEASGDTRRVVGYGSYALYEH